MNRCFLFPGQGAQYPGMGRDLYDTSRNVKSLFQRASEAAGFDVAALVFTGTEDEIKATDRSQVAITTVNLAARAVLRERGVESAGAAGFSLGEYAALVDAGVVSEEHALLLVSHRGRIMEEVSRSLDTPSGSPGMAAVIGLHPEDVARILTEHDVEGAYPANLNSPVQTVLSGTQDALVRAAEVLKSAGAKRVIPLKVSGPFHSPLMAAARGMYEEVLSDVPFGDPAKPVWSNVTGKRITSGEEAKRLCADQLVLPVRWVDEEALIAAAGYDQLLEVGPGEVLTGLWNAYRKSNDAITIECLPCGKHERIDALVA